MQASPGRSQANSTASRFTLEPAFDSPGLQYIEQLEQFTHLSHTFFAFAILQKGCTFVKKPTEKDFTATVIQMAQLRGWRVAHFRPSRTAHGWRTAVQGDGKGFPDLVMLRSGAFIVAELKMPKGKTTPEQDEWLKAFKSTGCGRVEIWTPDDWEEIERLLA